MKTLIDFIDEDVEILSVGLNPSPNSVRCGYPFATAQNRFWRALNASRLCVGQYEPGVEAMTLLLAEQHIGFTDVVKRPTAGASGLRAGDYRKWAPTLLAKIEQYRPRITWFHGKVAYSNFLRYALERKCESVDWGAQSPMPGLPRTFVTPNPSPANAVYSLRDIIEWYDRLAVFRDRG
jgi:TDG/mug DNA glycosylase family protein